MTIEVVANRGYFNGEEILACEEAGITVYVPKPMTSGAKAGMHYYNGARTHLSLNKDAKVPRAVQAVGRIPPTPILGGLHYQYVRI